MPVARNLKPMWFQPIPTPDFGDLRKSFNLGDFSPNDFNLLPPQLSFDHKMGGWIASAAPELKGRPVSKQRQVHWPSRMRHYQKVAADFQLNSLNMSHHILSYLNIIKLDVSLVIYADPKGSACAASRNSSQQQWITMASSIDPCDLINILYLFRLVTTQYPYWLRGKESSAKPLNCGIKTEICSYFQQKSAEFQHLRHLVQNWRWKNQLSATS